LSAKSAARKPSAAKTPPKPAPTPAKSGGGTRSAVLIGIVGLVVVGAVVAFLFWQRDDPDAALAAGTEPGVIAQVESLYNDIYVYRRPNGFYVLSFGAERLRYTESVVNPTDEFDLPVYYTQSMTAGLAYAEKLDSAAIVGLGGGRTAWYHHKSVPGLEMTAIELDPAVAEIADQFFSVRDEDNLDVEILDGRMWLAKNEDRMFDIIMVDAYRGPFVPFHLLTHEFYELVSERLNPGGVVVQNVEPSTMLFDSAVATIASAFDNLVFIEGQGNIVILAYDGPPKDEAELERIAAERQAQYGFRYPLPDILKRRYAPEVGKAEPLTDDFAPVEYLKAIERHNEKQT
jgi:spermidine synthase